VGENDPAVHRSRLEERRAAGQVTARSHRNSKLLVRQRTLVNLLVRDTSWFGRMAQPQG